MFEHQIVKNVQIILPEAFLWSSGWRRDVDFRDFQFLSDRRYSVKKIFYRAFLTRHRFLSCVNKFSDCDGKLIRSLLVNRPTLAPKMKKMVAARLFSGSIYHT
jgi:hypothetical protein